MVRASRSAERIQVTREKAIEILREYVSTDAGTPVIDALATLAVEALNPRALRPDQVRASAYETLERNEAEREQVSAAENLKNEEELGGRASATPPLNQVSGAETKAEGEAPAPRGAGGVSISPGPAPEPGSACQKCGGSGQMRMTGSSFETDSSAEIGDSRWMRTCDCVRSTNPAPATDPSLRRHFADLDFVEGPRLNGPIWRMSDNVEGLMEKIRELTSQHENAINEVLRLRAELATAESTRNTSPAPAPGATLHPRVNLIRRDPDGKWKAIETDCGAMIVHAEAADIQTLVGVNDNAYALIGEQAIQIAAIKSEHQDAINEVLRLRGCLAKVKAERNEALNAFRTEQRKRNECIVELDIAERTRNAAQAEANRLLEENRKLRAEADKYKNLVGSMADYSLSCMAAHHRRWAEDAFGKNYTIQSTIAHARLELAEIEAAPNDKREWIDLLRLAIDGYWRSGGRSIVADFHEKQRICEQRRWVVPAPGAAPVRVEE